METYRILSFRRSDLCGPALATQLSDLPGRQNNRDGAISEAIARYRKIRDRLEPIDAELRTLRAERERIDTRIQELQNERAAIPGYSAVEPDVATSRSSTYSNYRAVPHILDLLTKAKALSRSQAVDRRWLDEQLVKKVEDIGTKEAVSFGLIELRKARKIEYEGKPIRKIWLK